MIPQGSTNTCIKGDGIVNNKEKAILEKVKALLSKTQENGASEQEALAAANAAQRLLAKYNLEMESISIEEEKEISEEYIDYTRNWQAVLAHIVCKNMCCRGFTTNGKSFCIVGESVHRKTAMETIKSLIITCKKGYKAFLKQSGYNGRSKGLEKTYCLSFCEGVNVALGQQCRALALVVPDEVNKYTEKKYNLTPRNVDVRVIGNHPAQSQGRSDGYSAMSTKQLKQ